MLQRETFRPEADDTDRVGDRVESLHDRELEKGAGADGWEMGGEEGMHRCELEGKTGQTEREKVVSAVMIHERLPRVLP